MTFGEEIIGGLQEFLDDLNDRQPEPDREDADPYHCPACGADALHVMHDGDEEFLSCAECAWFGDH